MISQIGRGRFLHVLLIAGLFLVALNVYAAATFTMYLDITNPGPALSDSGAVFTFPDCLVPKSFGSGMTWDAATRKLSVHIGSIGAGVTKSFQITAESDSAGCVISGSVTGEWVYQTLASQPAPTEQPVPPKEEPVEEPEPTPPPKEEELAPEEAPEESLPPPEELGFTEESMPSDGGSIFGIGGGGYVSTDFLPAPVNEALKELRASAPVVRTVESIAAPVATAANTASAAVVAVNAASAAPHIVFNWINQARFFLLGFIRRKKYLPWGLVQNEWTRSPIQGASVSIVDADFKKVKETQFTDKEGRFGFLVSPGRYYLRIGKAGFNSKETEILTIGANPEQLNLRIGLIQISGGLTFIKALLSRTIKFFNGFLYAINPYILAVGTIVSAGAFLVIPTRLNLIVLIFYLVLDVVKIIFSFKTTRSFGVVVNAQTKTPVALGVVRVFSAEKNWLVGTRVTDDYGRFNFLILPGRYYMTCSKDNYLNLQTQPLEIKKAGSVNQVLELAPVNPNENKPAI